MVVNAREDEGLEQADAQFRVLAPNIEVRTVPGKRKAIFVYILKLKGERFYVGQSKHPDQRIKEHFAGKGSSWTKLHKPLEVVKIIRTNARGWRQALDMETHLTLELMKIFGWRNVRGGPYSAAELACEPVPLLRSAMCTKTCKGLIIDFE